MRLISALLVAVAFAAGVISPGVADAAVVGWAQDAAPRPERLQLVSPMLAPMAFSRFCLQYREECQVHRLKSALGLSGSRWSDVARVNAEVNRAITPQADDGDVVNETWLVAPPAGNCHDYAVTKRHELLALGWPSRALLLAEVVTHWGEHHLVLVVRTSQGDFVADNLYPKMRPWYAAHYRWLRIQTPENPMYWSALAPDSERVEGPALADASVRNPSETLIAADETEIALAQTTRPEIAQIKTAALKTAPDTIELAWTIAAPTQRYALSAGLDQGAFEIAGPLAIAAPQFAPAPAPQVAPAPAPPSIEFVDVRGGAVEIVDLYAADDQIVASAGALASAAQSGAALVADPYGYGPLVAMN